MKAKFSFNLTLNLKLFQIILTTFIFFSSFSNFNANENKKNKSKALRLLLDLKDSKLKYNNNIYHHSGATVLSFINIGDIPISTYRPSGSNSVWLKHSRDFDIPLTMGQKRISEALKIVEKGKPTFYACFKESNEIWKIQGNEIKADTNNPTSLTGLACRKSNAQNHRIMYGYLGSNQIKIFDVIAKGDASADLENFGNNKFIDLNFIFTQRPGAENTHQYFVSLLQDNADSTIFTYYIRQGPRKSDYKYEVEQNRLDLTSEGFQYNSQNVKKISMTMDRRFIIIVNYNPLQTNLANVYFIRKDNNNMKYHFNLAKILPNAQILEMKFIKITEFVIFKASISGQYFVGIINLYVRKLHFLYKVNSQDSDLIYSSNYQNFQSWDESTNNADMLLIDRSSVNHFKFTLVEMEKTPGDSNNNKDMLTCLNNNFNSNKSFVKLDLNQGNLCVECNKSNEKKEQGYCVDECSENAIQINPHECKICMHEEKNFFIKKNEQGVKSCVDNCGLNYVSNPDTFECYTCKSVNKWFYLHVCNDNKPEKGVCDSEHICKICKNEPEEKYYYKDLKNENNSRCMKKCERNMIEVPPPVYECKKCPENNFKIKNECVSQCPKYNKNTEGDPNVTGVCDTCPINPNDGKYRQNGVCKSQFDLGYYHDKYNIVLKCEEFETKKIKAIVDDTNENLWIECVEKCPEGYADRNNKCENCKAKNRVLATDGFCREKCGDYEFYDQSRNTCVSCKAINQYFFEGKCVIGCPFYTETDIGNHRCIDCKKENKVLHKRKCVDKCPNFMYKSDKNVCGYCWDDDNKIFHNGSCVVECPKTFIKKKDNNSEGKENYYCEACPTNKQIIHNNTCVKECPNGTVLMDGFCRLCSFQTGKEFYYDKTCYETCPEFTSIDQDKKICEDCPSGNFVENNVCKAKCSESHIYQNIKNTKNEDVKVCKKCPADKLFVDFYENKCLEKCSKGEVITGKVCKNCKKDNGKFLFENKCIESKDCPKEKYRREETQNYNECTLCTMFTNHIYLYKNQCVSKCEETEIDEVNKICRDCDYDPLKPNLDLFEKKCVGKCPKNKVLQNKKCIKCGNEKYFKEKKFFQKDKCVKSCEGYFHTNENDKLCEKCGEKDNKKYLKKQENKCVETCGDLKEVKDSYGNIGCEYHNRCQESRTKYNIYNKETNECIEEDDCRGEKGYFIKDFVCDKCSGSKKFVENSKCVEKCSKKYLFNNNQFLCYYCEYIFNGECLGNKKTCKDKETVRNDDTNICEPCKDKFFEDGKCVDSCKKGFIPNHDKMVCIPKEEIKNYDCLDGECDCEKTKKFEGDQCNIEIKNEAKYFKIEYKNDDHYKDYFVFEIKLLNSNNTETPLNFKDIDKISWQIFKNGKKYEGIKANSESNIFRIKRSILYKHLSDNQKDKYIQIKATIKLDNSEIETNSVNIYQIKSSFKVEDIKFKFSQLKKDNNSTRDKYLHKIKFEVDDFSCPDSDKNSDEVCKDIILKYYYINLQRKKFEITDYIRFKKFTEYIPDYSFIICEIKTKSGQIYEIKKENEQKNKSTCYTDLDVDDVKKIKDIKSKIDILNNFLNDKIGKEKFGEFVDFIQETIHKIFFDEENDSPNLDYKNVMDFVNNFINKLNKLDMENKVKEFTILNKVFSKLSKAVLDESKKDLFSRDDYPHIFNSVDNLVKKLVDSRKDNKTFEHENRKERNQENYFNMSNYLIDFMKDFSSKIPLGEKLSMEFDNIILSVDKYSEMQKDLFFNMPKPRNKSQSLRILQKMNKDDTNNNNDEEDNSIDEKIKNQRKNGKCDYIRNSLCTEENYLDLFMEFLNYTGEANKTDLAFISSIINNELLSEDLENETSMQSTSSNRLVSYNLKSKKELKYAETLGNTRSSIGKNDGHNDKTICVSKTEFEKSQKKGFEENIKKENETTHNSVYLKGLYDHYIKDCKTYFYKQNKEKPQINDNNNDDNSSSSSSSSSSNGEEDMITICRCKTEEEIFTIYNIPIFNMQKILQYNVIKYDLINPLSISIIGGSISLILIVSIILLIMDIIQDRRLLLNNYKSDENVLKTVFADLNGLIDANIYQFSFYATMYDYPFFKIINTYQYDQPRVFRFIYEIMIIIINLTFGLVNEFFMTKSVNDIIAERSIIEAMLDVNFLKALFEYILYTMINIAIVKIFLFFVQKFFLAYLYYDSLGEKIWSNRKNMIELYVKKYVIQPVDFTEKINQIFLRMMIMKKICKKVKNDGVKKTKTKKYYSEIKKKNTQLHSRSILCREPEPLAKIEEDTEHKSFVIVREHNFRIEGGVDTDLKKIEEHMKLLEIKKYIYQFKNPSRIDDSKKAFKKDDLKMYRIENLYKFADYKKHPNKISEEMKRNNRKKIVISMISIFILLAFLGSIFYILLLFISFAFQINGFRIIKSWLFPALGSLFILTFIVSYIMNFVRAYFLFRLSNPKNKIVKKIKEVIETGEIKYMYAISNFLSKYKKDLEFIGKG